MRSFRFSKKFLCFRVRIRVRVKVRFRVSGNTFSVKRSFGKVYKVHVKGMEHCTVTQ